MIHKNIVYFEDFMRKAIFSFLILLILIFFCQCATNFPNDFEGIIWGLPMDKCEDYLNSNNIKYKTNYSDYDEYLETEGTFFGIENVSIQYHFLKNKFYKGSVYIKQDIEFIDELEKNT